jgi:hypothetical protein
MGLLDATFADLAVTLTDLFVDNPRTFTRTVRTYDASTGATTPTDTVASIKTTPPAPFKTEELGGSVDNIAILATDLQVVIPSKNSAGFDLYPTDEATVAVVHNGVTYKVMAVEDFNSGDEVAARRALLRK